MIENYFRSGAQGTFFQNIPIFPNHSIVILISSICLFEVFRRIHLPSSRLITFLGKSTFMVYLMHDNYFFYKLWNLKDWITILATNLLSFLVQLLTCGAKTFALECWHTSCMSYWLLSGKESAFCLSKELRNQSEKSIKVINNVYPEKALKEYNVYYKSTSSFLCFDR